MFTVKESFALPEEELEFRVLYDKYSKRKFAELSSDLGTIGYTPELTGTRDDCVLVLRKTPVGGRRLSRLPVLFANFTLVTLVVFALLQTTRVYEQLIPSLQGNLVFFGFSATIGVILGGHELGQRLVARWRRAGHASSYLIPAIPFLPPFLPTLGFAASQKEPALNRDAMFDTVISGPLFVLGLAIAFYVVGELTSVQAPSIPPHSLLANTTVSINPNAIQMAIDSVLRPILPSSAPGFTQVSPIADGATTGFIVAFICLLPMAFFDGGFLSATVGGERLARGTSYLSVLALMVLETPTYWAIAVVALLLAGRQFQLTFLDEVSVLSPSRKWVFAGSIVLSFLCLPFPHNLGTLPLSWFH